MFNEGEKRFSLWLPFSEKNGEDKKDFAHVQNVSSNRVKSTNAGVNVFHPVKNLWETQFVSICIFYLIGKCRQYTTESARENENVTSFQSIISFVIICFWKLFFIKGFSQAP